MKKDNEYNPLSYDNEFFKYLELKNVHPIEYIDMLFIQKSFLMSILVEKLSRAEIKEVYKKLEAIRLPKLDK